MTAGEEPTAEVLSTSGGVGVVAGAGAAVIGLCMARLGPKWIDGELHDEG
ncbi:MAG: hypothetical protein ACTH31_09840 [Pseudoclavibacter sp.]